MKTSFSVILKCYYVKGEIKGGCHCHWLFIEDKLCSSPAPRKGQGARLQGPVVVFRHHQHPCVLVGLKFSQQYVDLPNPPPWGL